METTSERYTDALNAAIYVADDVREIARVLSSLADTVGHALDVACYDSAAAGARALHDAADRLTDAAQWALAVADALRRAAEAADAVSSPGPEDGQ